MRSFDRHLIVQVWHEVFFLCPDPGGGLVEEGGGQEKELKSEGSKEKSRPFERVVSIYLGLQLWELIKIEC